jgi:hypothetical protein
MMLTSYIAPPLLVSSAPVVVNAAPAEISGLRLPSYAVASSPTDGRVENRLSGGGNLPLLPEAAVSMDASVAAGSPAGLALTQANTLSAPSIRYTSQFLAQLLAQLPSSANAGLVSQLASDEAPASILDARLMELFGQVKYKPSMAAKPAPMPSGVAAVLAAAEAASAVAQVGTAAQPRVPILNFTMMRAANNNERAATAGNDNLPRASSFRPEPSLVRSQGFGAYGATAERNARYLRLPTPEVTSDGSAQAALSVPAEMVNSPS